MTSPDDANQAAASLAALAAELETENRRQNWSALLTLARDVRIRFPLAEAGYRHEAAALAALADYPLADALLEAAARLFPDSESILWQAADLAGRSGNVSCAIGRWHAVLARCPDAVEAHLGLAATYKAASQLHDADRVLSAAIERFPAEARLFIQWSDIALHLNDWREAARRLQVVRERFPTEPLGYSMAGHALRHLQRCQEADDITRAGLAIIPDDPDILESYCWTAMVSGDLAEAGRRWRDLIARHPSCPTGYAGLADVLGREQSEAEAETVLQQGIAALPDNGYLAEAFAWRATWRTDWTDAAERWRTVRDRFAASPNGHHQLGIALKQLGRLDEAEQVLQAGARMVPNHLALAVEHAWCANARNDWPEAMRRWQELASCFPLDIMIQEGLVNARLGAADAGLPAIGADADGPAAAAGSPQELLKNFESLGENCEFGLMQRYFGLEPISLFRWVAIGLINLAEAFENGLAGVGSPEQTLVEVSKGREYFVADSRYHFTMHTFVQQETIEQSKFFLLQCRRLRYLAGKILEDLRCAEKIFVFFQDSPLNEQPLLRLHAAMRQHGDVTLLLVLRQDAAHPHGTLSELRPGLILGYIERFGKGADNTWDISHQGWLEICRGADRMHRRQTIETAVA